MEALVFISRKFAILSILLAPIVVSETETGKPKDACPAGCQSDAGYCQGTCRRGYKWGVAQKCIQAPEQPVRDDEDTRAEKLEQIRHPDKWGPSMARSNNRAADSSK